MDDVGRQKRPVGLQGPKLSDDGKQYVGPNLMGRLLMELRDAGGQLDYSLPDGATSFQDICMPIQVHSQGRVSSFKADFDVTGPSI